MEPTYQSFADEMRRQSAEWLQFAMECAQKGYEGMSKAAAENAVKCEETAEKIERIGR
jgi:hypothetical protein